VEAAEQGAERMMLEVADTNEPALAFYAASGFAEIARRRNYYSQGVDAVVMELAPLPGRDTLEP
jgi:ribosomal protein S18 acetylase RimI-like enzyme